MSEDPTKFEHESHAALDRAEASLEQVERIMSGEPLTPDEYQVAYDTGWSASMNKQRLRIVALEAASRCSKIKLEEVHAGRKGFNCYPTLRIADEFLAWLEADK